MGNVTRHDGLRRYSTVVDDNRSLIESKIMEKQLAKYLQLNNEAAILLDASPVNTIQDLIYKYSNNDHEVYYQKKTHSLLIRGSMFVPVFHALVQDAKKFNFTNITLE